MLRALTLVFCLLPATAAAQPWAEASRAGKFNEAVSLLQEIVTAADPADPRRDPEPLEMLARLYADGRGVEKDMITACALATTTYNAREATVFSRQVDYKTEVQRGQELVDRFCGELTKDDRLLAMSSQGCFAFGLREQTLTVGGHDVLITRLGVRARESERVADGSLMCPALVTSVRTISLHPPTDAAPGVSARHFVELCYWSAGGGTAARYVSTWHLYEVSGDSIQDVAVEAVQQLQTWPGKAERPVVTFEMVRSGHIRWKIAGAPPRRGWLMVPDSEEWE